MDTSLGNERTATLPGRYRTACTIAAVVVMAAFAKDALPAFGWTTPVTTIKHEAVPVQMPVAVAAPRMKTVRRIKSGLASWYGKMLQGRLTASGRPFDMNELTAAHRTLPFGSKVKVTDLRNKRSVVVTITDRGPVPEDRVIDLSFEAAKELWMVGMGVDPVRLELLAFQN
jgi:rare lipoprotein A